MLCYKREFTTADIALTKVVLMLRAYLDDSGKFTDPNELAVVVAGVIGDKDEWELFDPKWRAILKRFKVSELHMKDFAHNVGEYKNWDEPKRQDFLGQLWELGCAHMKKPIGALLPKQYFRDLPTDIKSAWFNDPYFVCLQETIILGIDIAIRLFSPPENLQILCDDQPEFEGKANRVYRACENQLEHGKRLQSFGFASSKSFPGLQFADLIAYEALKIHREMINESFNIDRPKRWPLRQIIDKTMSEFEFYTAEKMAQTRPLKF